MIFHVASSCNGLHRKSLLSVQLVLEVVPFVHEFGMLLLVIVLLLNGGLLFFLLLLSELNLHHKHLREHVGIIGYSFKLLSQF